MSGCHQVASRPHCSFPFGARQPISFDEAQAKPNCTLAAGGGWPVDLSRYNGLADMYVDYIRVYGKPPDTSPRRP
jgi:hypothetical protein